MTTELSRVPRRCALRSCVLAAVLTLGLGPIAGAFAAADSPAPLPDEPVTAREHGSIGGWLIHSIGESIVIVSPDGRFVSAGRLYTRDGVDIGAALTGREPRSLDLAGVNALSALLQEARLKPHVDAAFDAGCADRDPAYSCASSAPAVPAGAGVAGLPSTALPSSAPADPAMPQPAAILESLEAAWGHTIGHGGPRVSMVLDPECPFCGAAMATMRPALEAGRVHLRMIPVAVVSPRSGTTLAALLTAENPGAALYDFVLAKTADSATEAPKLRVEGVSAEMRQGVADNITLMRGLGIRQVPFFAWTDSDGRARILSGVPESGDVFSN